MKLFTCLSVFYFLGVGYSLNSAPISPDEVSDDQIIRPTLSGVVQPSSDEDEAMQTLVGWIRECARRPGFYDDLASEPKRRRMGFVYLVDFVERRHGISWEEASDMINPLMVARCQLVCRFEQARERLAQEFERLSQKRQQVLEVSNKSDTEE